jgi:hypothetical protein
VDLPALLIISRSVSSSIVPTPRSLTRSGRSSFERAAVTPIMPRAYTVHDRSKHRPGFDSPAPGESAWRCKSRSTRSVLVAAAFRPRRRANKYFRTSHCAILWRVTKWRFCAHGRYVVDCAGYRSQIACMATVRAHNELDSDNILVPAVGQWGDCHAGTLLRPTINRRPDPCPVAGTSHRALRRMACRAPYLRRQGTWVHCGSDPVQRLRANTWGARLELAP